MVEKDRVPHPLWQGKKYGFDFPGGRTAGPSTTRRAGGGGNFVAGASTSR
jgi:hypothetical protein